jgi:nucleosome binding factor SPN SPT16 subunit
MRNASKACIALMNPYFVEEMSNVLDEEKKVKHSALANKVDSKLDDSKFWTTVELPSKLKMPSDFDPSQLDWTIGPLIQSGGKFDLKPNAQIDDEILHPGVIIATMGLRYKSYCSLIARTYLVDPNKSQESNYKLLLQVHGLVMKEIRDGANVKEIYGRALALVKSKKPELEKHFLKNVGAGIGIETRDGSLILNGKSTRTIKDGMTLCVTTGFSDVENPNPQDKKSKIYSMVLSDTVRVSASEPVIFTGDAPSDLDATSFFFKDDDEPEPTPKKSKKDSSVGAVATKNITKTKLRAERTTQTDEGAEARRREHQKELQRKKQEEGLARFAEVTGDQNGTAVKKFKRFESYKRDNQFPPRVRDLAIVMDMKNSTVVLPIMGRPVPFHIQTIKNASKSDEGDFAYLRINFLSPGQGVGRKDDQPFEDASAHFVRSLTFRSHDGDRLQDIANSIGNMKKEAVKREQEKKELEDVVEQDKLIEIRSKLL